MNFAYKTLWSLGVLAMLSFGGQAAAQSWNFTVSEEAGQPGETVDVIVTIEHTGDEEAWSADIQVSDLTVFSNVDFSQCTANFPDAFIESCGFRAAPNDDVIRIQWASNVSGQGWPASETALISFEIAGGATPGTEVPLPIVDTNANGTITTNDGMITVSSGPQPDLVFDPAPSNLTFSAEATQQDSQDVQICNSESGQDGSEIDVTGITVNTTDSSGGSFDQSNTCTDPLAPGDCCTVTVAFNSQNGGDATSTGELDITTSAGNGAWSLEGTSTDGPAAALTVSPQTDGDFGQLLTNDESDTRTFVVSNSGQANSNLSVDSAADPGGDFTVTGGTCDPGTTTLDDGESCTVVVTFAPTLDGVQNQTLTVNGTDTINGNALSDSVAVTGEGVTEPRYSSSPAPGTINLGQIQPGGSLNQDVVITNEGNDPLDVSCGTLNDPDGVFTLTPSPADFTGIAGGASESFNVACTVPDVSSYEATLQCSTNEDGAPTYDYTFRCSGRPLIIPTMQPWGLVLLSMLMLMVGGLSIRYFRV